MEELTIGVATGISTEDSPLSCGPALDWQNGPELLWIKAEIEKTTGIPPLDADWHGLLSRSEQLLALSTDWLILCVFARANVQVRGASVLHESMARLATMAQSSWFQMHPEVPPDKKSITKLTVSGLRRRASYFDWFVTGVASALVAKKVKEAKHSDLVAAESALALLDQVLAPLMNEAYPGVRALREAVTNAAAGTDDSNSNESSVTSSTKGSSSSLTSVNEFPPPVPDVETADAVLIKVRQALFAVADSLQRFNAADPAPFRLRRIAAWLRVDGITASEDGAVTATGPDTERHLQLRAALETDLKGVLEEAESSLKPFPLWLDANYLAFQALSRMGPDYKAARDAVLAETVGLVARLPTLLKLHFANEVPLAATDTSEWLQTELSKLHSPASEGATLPTTASDDLATLQRTAEELVLQGSIQDSFKLFDDSIREARSGRERFRWRIAAARHAARHDRTDVALNLLDGLDREAADFRLDSWEPELWADVLKTVLEIGRTRARGRSAAEIQASLPDLEKRLARLDFLAAVRLANGREEP